MSVNQLAGQAQHLKASELRELIGLLEQQLEQADAQPQHSLLELAGLGAEIWQGVDAQVYINELRDEWDNRP